MKRRFGNTLEHDVQCLYRDQGLEQECMREKHHISRYIFEKIICDNRLLECEKDDKQYVFRIRSKEFLEQKLLFISFKSNQYLVFGTVVMEIEKWRLFLPKKCRK